MEKPPRSKGARILKYLSKPSSFVISGRPAPPSPGREHRRAAFSGPIGTIVPEAARHRAKRDEEFSSPEPTSPKVSCIGQIKKRSGNDTKKKKKRNTGRCDGDHCPWQPPTPRRERRFPSFVKMFGGRVRPSKREEEAAAAEPEAPAMGQLRRFTSGRDALAGFDWREVNVGGYDEEDDEVIIPHSAPILMGGGGVVGPEPKKEVNIWKRRTTSPPAPLEL